MRAGPFIATAGACTCLFAAGCGSDSSKTGSTVASVTAPATAAVAGETSKLPAGAVGPVHPDDGPGAEEASPEAPAEGPSTGSLSGGDEEAVAQSVRFYIDALDRRDAAEVCSLFAPSALDLRQLPLRRGGCRDSVGASIGYRPADGGPAWKKTEIYAIKAVSVQGIGARVTATVTHHFSDRKYVSVEDDVIYLRKVGGRWVLAKPSGTFFRAVGYAQPPLSAFEPPR